MAADLIVRILTDASQADTGIGKFQSSLNSLTGPALAVVGGITAIGAVAVNAASDAEQAMGGVDAVFGDSAAQIKKWAGEAATAVGLSKAEYGNFAAVVGAQLKNLGVPMEDVAGGTDELIRLGADLAATYGGTTSEAVSALSSALRGEADPAERYGLMLNQTAVNAKLAADGMTGLTGEAATAAKAQAIMALATEQAGGAIGQYGRESNTVAGQQQTLTAQWNNAAAALGEGLLPVVTPILAALAQMAGWVGRNVAVVGPLIAAVGALAAGILALNVAMSAARAIAGIYAAVQATIAAASYGSAGATYLLTGATVAQRVAQVAAIAVMKAVTAAQWLWNAAMTANPIGIIIAAVVALVAAFVWLWNENEAFRNFFISMWEGIAAFFTGLWEGLLVVVQAVVTWFQQAWENVARFFQAVWQVAVAVVTAYFNVYKTIFTAIFNAVRAVVQAVVSFFVNAWKNAVAGVQAVLQVLGRIFKQVFDAIMVPINAVINAFKTVVSWIQNIISALGRIKIPDVFGAIGDLFGASGGGARSAPAAALSTAGGPALYSARGVSLRSVTRAASTSGAGTTINVNGGLDSADAIARRIQQVLTQRERRVGGVTINRSTR